MNNSNILFSLKKPFNGNQKDWPRFKREFNAIVNASKASKLLRKRDALISTSKSDDLDLSLDDNVKMQNLYDLNTQLFSYLQLNVTSPKYIMLIDKCMNKFNEKEYCLILGIFLLTNMSLRIQSPRKK